ncbi:aromatic amino acid lyase [Billgrantia tianxiuensis]|jgi:histidine ammonia-lyase|uniref:tyrosine ammonia-lyase n=1 Tax=Billgrantia tianxiuensis TaxID=2497861 RepID=A0A6I6SV19_9GAMM|nr:MULTISPECIES: aromatic amino acid ammonia-lyase [Halomonas]MCE8034133.1 aromatic amino acid lyase [Halomonas sp. MCCC 1A11057]QHC51033.1 aromatic amino acid lyase [Halomonas tianxiuensis]
MTTLHDPLAGPTSSEALTLDGSAVTLEDVLAVTEGRRRVVLSSAPEFRERIARGNAFLERLLEEDGVVYGVTTGYGDSCTRAVPASDLEQLPRQLYTFHGCGLGEVLSVEAARAVVMVRLVSLCRGVSGVSVELLERLAWLLEHDVVPVIPEEGSVGASGDLTPLSYLAAVLCGEREVFDRGQRRATSEVFAEHGLVPYRLKPKEGLALMNGTAVMTALGVFAFARTTYLARLATRITALSVYALDGNPYHFDADLFAAKPHPGQNRVAERLRDDLHAPATPRNSPRLQDRYSTRCAPHVIGVVEDALPWWRQFLETELNSANDNPLIDAEHGKVMHGGHFYGGHVAFAMDSLKQACANLADLLDRQLALLVDTRFNHGLPSNLSGATPQRASLNHGYKAVQIGASAWTAEALKLTMPASVFSRSTECHNQDKVSMGTIAARDALRVLTLVEQVAAATLHAACQAVELRSQIADATPLPERLAGFLDVCRSTFPALGEDRALEPELRTLCGLIRQRRWSLYDA